MIKPLFTLVLVCACYTVFAQQADLPDKKALGTARPAVTVNNTTTLPADKTDKNATGIARPAAILPATDTVRINSTEKLVTEPK